MIGAAMKRREIEPDELENRALEELGRQERVKAATKAEAERVVKIKRAIGDAYHDVFKRGGRDFEVPATGERLRHAGEGVEIGRGERDRATVVTMRDAPIERMAARGVISKVQYDAAKKYHIHWHRGGLCAPLHSLDLNRVFASDGSSCGMPVSEAQAFHRQQFRAAIAHLAGKEGHNMQSVAIVTAVVCEESILEDVGYRLGWGNKPQAIAAATERLRVALGELARHWGM